MFVNIISTYRGIVAICDEDLLGKTFEEGKFQLDLKESFYGGPNRKKMEEPEVISIMKNFLAEDSTFNIVGQKSIDCAIKADIITPESIKKIAGIPFAMVLL